MSSTTGAIEKGRSCAARPVTPPPHGLSRGKRARSSRSTGGPCAGQAVRARRARRPGAHDDRVVATHRVILTERRRRRFELADGFGACRQAVHRVGARDAPRRRGRLGERVLGHQGAARPRLRRRGRRPPALPDRRARLRVPPGESAACPASRAGTPCALPQWGLRRRRLPHLPERGVEVHHLGDGGARDRLSPRADPAPRRRPRARALEPAPAAGPRPPSGVAIVVLLGAGGEPRSPTRRGR